MKNSKRPHHWTNTFFNLTPWNILLYFEHGSFNLLMNNFPNI